MQRKTIRLSDEELSVVEDIQALQGLNFADALRFIISYYTEKKIEQENFIEPFIEDLNEIREATSRLQTDVHQLKQALYIIGATDSKIREHIMKIFNIEE